jgi:hypothetical protein
MGLLAWTQAKYLTMVSHDNRSPRPGPEPRVPVRDHQQVVAEITRRARDGQRRHRTRRGPCPPPRDPRPHAAGCAEHDRRHPDDRLVVTGPIDATSAPELHRALRHRSRGGTRPLVVDPTAGTHLAGAAVAVLHDNPGPTLLAPTGSTTQHVLTLVALRCRTSPPNRRADPADPHGRRPPTGSVPRSRAQPGGRGGRALTRRGPARPGTGR